MHCIWINYLNSLLNSGLLTIFICNSFFNFLGLNTKTKLAIKILTKSVNQTTTILFEASCYVCKRSSQCNVTLTQNMIGAKHAPNRSNAKGNRRTIELNEFQTSLYIGNCQILFGNFLSIFFAIRSMETLTNTFMDLIDSFLSFINNIIYLGSSLACHNGTCHDTDDTGNS